jgi:hypothetical protein
MRKLLRGIGVFPQQAGFNWRTTKGRRFVKNESFIEQYVKFRDEVWEKDPHYRGFLAALEELNQETDRGVALVATSFLDKQLKDALAAFLIENASARDLLSGFNAPFGTFGTRIAGCHALGLITDNEARQSDILRKVRNQFAHQRLFSER